MLRIYSNIIQIYGVYNREAVKMASRQWTLRKAGKMKILKALRLCVFARDKKRAKTQRRKIESQKSEDCRKKYTPLSFGEGPDSYREGERLVVGVAGNIAGTGARPVGQRQFFAKPGDLFFQLSHVADVF